MARKGFQATIGASLGNGEYVVDAARATEALAAAIAVGVADGASPTQAHVTAIDTAYGAQAHVSLTYDTTAVTSKNQLKRALDAIWRQVEGTGV